MLQRTTNGVPQKDFCLHSPASVEFNGKEVRGLTAYWDTGSSVCCIAREIANKLSLPIMPTQQEVKSITNSKMADVTVCTLKIGYGDDIILPDTLFCVMDPEDFEYELLIGQDIIGYGELHTKYNPAMERIRLEFEIDPSVIPDPEI